MTTTYDMNDTATLAHDPYVSEYGNGYGGAYGTGYDTDHGSDDMVGKAYDDGPAIGGAYGGGYGDRDGYEPGFGTTSTDTDAEKPTIGDRVDTALDGMRNVVDKVVGTTKEKLSDGGWDRAEREANKSTPDDGITYNQIHEATTDPCDSMDGCYEEDMGTTANDGFVDTMDTTGGSHNGAMGGMAYDFGPTNAASNVAQVYSDINTATYFEDEI